VIAVAAVVEPPLVLLGARLTERLRSRPAIGRWLDRGLGAVLVALGVKLAVAER
jgi:threonine/homoserine/homoserine lactone efflux protein